MSASTNKFISTTIAAIELGISTTSVQKLVDGGVLEAFTTKGGHRRISIESIEAYKKSNFSEATVDCKSLYILHHGNDLDESLKLTENSNKIILISNPLDFIFKPYEIKPIFIDARHPYIQELTDTHKMPSSRKSIFYIYNCEKIPPGNPLWGLNSEHLIYGNINIVFILGFLSGLNLHPQMSPLR